MAYCDLEGKFLGNKLNKMFREQNRNKIANLVSSQPFREWFGNGRVDVDGNPVIDETLSFTNEKGEKMAIFDFDAITLQDYGEVKSVLTSNAAINLYRGDLFINNTSKNYAGQYSAKNAMRMINTLNYYFPDLLRIEQYSRTEKSRYSKDVRIPMPVVKVNEASLRTTRPMFSVHDTNKTDQNSNKFSQIRPAQELAELREVVNKFKVYDLTETDLQNLEERPEIDSQTYDSLVDFVKKINPDFRIEVIDNLSQNGIAYIQDFLIQVDTDGRFQAMPEEVSHFFVELLPKDSALRKELLNNITSFSIYSTTYQAYKNLPEYQVDGKPDFDKIKREAAAKLISEFIYATTSGDQSRIELLTRTKDNFIIKWWNRFLNMLRDVFSLQRKERYEAYLDAAQKIISGDISDLTLDELIDNINKDIFFQAGDANKIEMATKILEGVTRANKLDDLQKVIRSFRSDVKKSFISIIKDKGYNSLRLQLQNNNENDINEMSEVFDSIKNIDITGSQINSMSAADNQLINMAEFIDFLNKMSSKIAPAIDHLVDTYMDTGRYMNNLTELQAFRNIYLRFQNMVSTDLAEVLSGSGIETEVITNIRKSATIFETIDSKIRNKLRDNFFKFFKDTIGPQNAIIIDHIQRDLNTLFNSRITDPTQKQKVSEAVEKLGFMLRSGLNRNDIKSEFMQALKDAGVSAKMRTHVIVQEQMNRVYNIYTPDRMVEELLNGTGKDIDGLSRFSHWVTAANKNHDVFISNIAKFILDKRTDGQNQATFAIREYNGKIDPTLQRLKEIGIDEYKAGEAITYIDEVVDMDPAYEENNNRRKIIKFLNPTTNEVNIERDRLLDEKNSIASEWYKETNPDKKEELRKKLINARNTYNTFLDDYFNSPFTEEYTNFLKKWNNDQEFLDMREQWSVLSRNIRDLRAQVEGNRNDFDAFNQLRLTLKERSDMLKEEGKTEEEIARIKKLKDYFSESEKYRIVDPIQTARNIRASHSNYQARIEYGFKVFRDRIKTSGEQPTVDVLEEVLQNTLKDSTIRVRYKYLNIIRDEGREDRLVESEEDFLIVQDFLMDQWAAKVQIRVKNDKYYSAIDKAFKDMEDLRSTQGLTEMESYKSRTMKRINEIISSRKDEYGQKNPDLLTEEEIKEVTELEDALMTFNEFNVTTYSISDKVKENLKNGSATDRKYIPYIEEYEQLVKDYSDMLFGRVPRDLAKMQDMKNSIIAGNDIMKNLLTKEQENVAKSISQLWKTIGELSEKKPTEAYWEKMEDVLDVIEKINEDYLRRKDDPNLTANQRKIIEYHISNTNGLFGILNQAIYDRQFYLVDAIINDEYFAKDEKGNEVRIEFLRYFTPSAGISQAEVFNQEFYDWFLLAHKEGEIWVRRPDENGEPIGDPTKVTRTYIRRMFYTFTEPPIDRPDLYDVKVSRSLTATRIADEYRSKPVSWKQSNDMEDWTVNNKDSTNLEYLPLSRKQQREKGRTDKKYFKYMNEKFYALQDGTDEKSRNLNKFLNITLKTYMEEQESKPDNLKPMFNLPVTMLDRLQEDKQWVTNFPDRIKRIKQKATSIFTKQTESDAEDMLEGIEQKRDLDEETQTWMTSAVPRMGMNSKVPIERVNRNVIHAMTMYIENSKDYDARVDLNPVVKGLLDVMRANEAVGDIKQKGRADIIDKIYSQFILEELPDNITNQRFFRKVASTMMMMTGWKLSGDIVGGSVNYIQANINNFIEAAAGRHVTPRNYATGLKYSTLMMGEFLADFNKKDNLSYWTMMYQTFDFIHGEWSEDLLERTSSAAKRFDWRKMLMYPRKNGELHAQSAMAIAILDNKKITNTLDGKQYPMWDIYKKEGNQLVLKDGFDHALYNPVDGTEFRRIKNKIHSINLDLHGNYAKFTQTEASRHSLGKLAENMKRWFVPGFQRRFGRESFDVNNDDLERGYYNTAANFIRNTVGNIHRLDRSVDMYRYYTSSPLEKANLKRAGIEFLAAIALVLTTSFIFGYDDDDPDRNKKLKKNSQIYNIALIIFLRAYAEQTAYIPVPPFGFTEMSRNLLDPFSVAKSAVGNAAGAFALTLFTMEYYLGDPFGWEHRVFYQRDTGSRFAKKGDLKLVNYLLKTIGYTGAQLDPAYYIKNYEQLQNRLK